MERHLTGPSQRVQGKSPQQSGVTNPNFKAQSVSLYRPSARRPLNRAENEKTLNA